MLSLLYRTEVRMKHTATITSKGQVTIPQEVRRHLGLKQGDLITFEVEDGRTVLKPYRGETNPFASYAGALDSFDTEEEAGAWLSDLRDWRYLTSFPTLEVVRRGHGEL